MGFPSLDSKVLTKERMLQSSQLEARNIRVSAESFLRAAETNNLSINNITQISQHMRAAIDLLTEMVNTPGMEAYAIDNLGRGIESDTLALITLCDEMIDECMAVFSYASQKDDGFGAANHKIEDGSTGQKGRAKGDVSTRSLTPEEMTGVINKAREILAAID